jgi:hypothetical protein
MTTVILSIVIVGLVIALGFMYSKNQFLQINNDALVASLETAHQEKEMIDATRQLLRNEVTVLKSQIRVMESKSMHPVIEDAPKPKKKKFAPKMKAKKNEQK